MSGTAPEAVEEAVGRFATALAQALSCPFCGAAPERSLLFGHHVARCFTLHCVAAGTWHRLDAWNHRVPAAAERHPGADAARLCIVNARQASTRETMLHYLAMALDALRPPAAPPSATFWLGSDGT